MSMTIAELIGELERFQEEYGDEVEVRFASQPSWPFEYSIDQIAVVNLNQVNPEELDGLEEGEDRDDFEAHLKEQLGDDEFIVYLAEGMQVGYLPGIARREIGWS